MGALQAIFRPGTDVVQPSVPAGSPSEQRPLRQTGPRLEAKRSINSSVAWSILNRRSAKPMSLTCPSCGSRNVRHSNRESILEKLGSLFGKHAMRCRDCSYRFTATLWKLSDLRYSRCPLCYRMDLTEWSEEHYLPRFGTLVLMRLGARRLRCEYCRFNFAGFRPIKIRFSQHANRARAMGHAASK